jgi:hypothetical protein
MNGCDALAAGGRWTPDIAVGSVGPDGTVYVAKQFCGKPYLAMSRDNGNTWTRVRVANTELVSGQYGGYELSAEANAQGDVFVMFIGANDLPYLAVSLNHGRTFGTPIMVAAPGVRTAFWPFMSIDSHGRLDLLYMGTTSTGYTLPSEKWFEYLAEVPFPTIGPHPLIYTATTTPKSYPWLVGPGGPDRAPLNCGCDYVSVASAPSGAAWGLTDDYGPRQLGQLASVLGPPPSSIPAIRGTRRPA